MARKDVVSVYGRLGLIVAAFALVAGIIAAPIIPRLGSSVVAVSDTADEPDLRLPIAPVSLQADKPG